MEKEVEADSAKEEEIREQSPYLKRVQRGMVDSQHLRNAWKLSLGGAADEA